MRALRLTPVKSAAGVDPGALGVNHSICRDMHNNISLLAPVACSRDGTIYRRCDAYVDLVVGGALRDDQPAIWI